MQFKRIFFEEKETKQFLFHSSLSVNPIGNYQTEARFFYHELEN